MAMLVSDGSIVLRLAMAMSVSDSCYTALHCIGARAMAMLVSDSSYTALRCIGASYG